MARKQALREFQTRLAERMLAARSQARGGAWLAVEAGGQGFLVRLADAGEIFATASLVPLPHAQPWCAGVANLRGQLHTVVDLGRFFGLAAGDPVTAQRAQLLAFNPRLDINAALRVDRLSGLRNAAQMRACQDPPAPADNPSGVVAVVRRPAFAPALLCDEAGRVWQELDLGALARHETFLRIAA